MVFFPPGGVRASPLSACSFAGTWAWGAVPFPTVSLVEVSARVTEHAVALGKEVARFLFVPLWLLLFFLCGWCVQQLHNFCFCFVCVGFCPFDLDGTVSVSVGDSYAYAIVLLQLFDSPAIGSYHEANLVGVGVNKQCDCLVSGL